MKKQTLCRLGLMTLLMLAFPAAAEDEEQSWPSSSSTSHGPRREPHYPISPDEDWGRG